MNDPMSGSEHWLSVIGKCLAMLSLEANKSVGGTIVDKARYLEGLGIDRGSVAEMLGTSSASISEMLRRTKKKGGGRGGRKAKKK